MRNSQKRTSEFFCFGLLAAAGALAFAAVERSSVSKSQSLVAVPDLFDFGTVRPGEHDGEFTLTNNASKGLQIIHVILTCSCETVEVPRKRLEPNESVNARFRWDSRGQYGDRQKRFSVVYRLDGEEGTRFVDCSFRGSVDAPVQFTPKELTFSLLDESPQTAVIRFSSREGAAFAIANAACAHPAFSAECTSSNEVSVSFAKSLWTEHDTEFGHTIVVSTIANGEFVIPLRFTDANDPIRQR
jgi:hypothetical protein